MDNTFPVVITVDGTTHNFTEVGIRELIQSRKDKDYLKELVSNQNNSIRDIKTQVRDFFSESEYWDEGTLHVNKAEVNDFLDSLDIRRLTSKYQATYTITGTFIVEVEDEDEVESTFVDNVSVDFYDGDIQVDNIDVMDIEEND